MSDELVKAIATMAVKVGGEIVPAGKPFKVDPDELAEMPFASEIEETGESENASSVQEPSMSDEERAELIATAVKEAADAKPERDKQPTVADVSDIAGFKVTAAEIAPVFEALQANQE